MDTYLAELNDVAQYDTNVEEWIPPSISVAVATSLINETPITIDIMQTLGQLGNAQIDKTDVYWLPSKFNKDDKKFIKEELMSVFALACKEAGFNVKNRGYDRRRAYLTVVCPRHRYYKEAPSKATQHSPTTQTQLPIIGKDKVCPFYFNVYFSNEHRRWFLPAKQGGSTKHIGHPKLDPSQIQVQIKHLGSEAVTLADQCLKNHLPPSVIKTLLYETTGATLSSKQLEGMKRNLRQGIVLSIMSADGVETQVPADEATAADRLLARLQSDKTKAFVVLFADFETGHLRFRQRRRGAAPQDIDSNALADEVDSAAAFSEKVRNALSITGSGLILLALAWTTESAQRLFRMYPEYKSGDITFKTNAEKRELQTESGKAADGQTFSHTFAYLHFC